MPSDVQPLGAAESGNLEVVPIEHDKPTGWSEVGSVASAGNPNAPRGYAQTDERGGVLYTVSIGGTRATPAYAAPDVGSDLVGYFIENNMGLVTPELAVNPFAHECFTTFDDGSMTRDSLSPDCRKIFLSAGYDPDGGRFPATQVGPLLPPPGASVASEG